MIDTELLILLRRGTEAIVTFLGSHGIENDYGPKTLAWLERFIIDRRDSWSDEEKEGVSQNVGAFFGECLIRAYDGEWDNHEFGIAVSIRKGESHLMVFPLSKVDKFMDNGESDSFVMLFSVIRYQLSLSNGSPQSDQATDQ